MASAGKIPSGTDGVIDLTASTMASFGRRLGALLIDWVLCTVVASLLVVDLRANPWPQLGVFVLVNAFFLGLFGQTPGMALLRIRCVSLADGGAIGLPRAIVRAALLALVIPALINDGDGRGLHDRAARSVVLQRS
ncbi:MAG TPA: RDD family protein [Actinoplanes sp.]|nr:RDD family protein [Actinoplanes sp.]